MWNLYIINCYKESIIFLIDERDFLPVSTRSGANFDVYPQYSRVEDCVYSLKDFCTASTNRLLMQCFLYKYKSKS